MIQCGVWGVEVIHSGESPAATVTVAANQFQPLLLIARKDLPSRIIASARLNHHRETIQSLDRHALRSLAQVGVDRERGCLRKDSPATFQKMIASSGRDQPDPTLSGDGHRSGSFRPGMVGSRSGPAVAQGHPVRPGEA